MDLEEMKKSLEENGYNLWHSTDTSQNDATEEVEKDNFTKEEFDKACEDLGLEDSGKEMNDVDDFFDRLNQIEDSNW
jgi:basic membrane lipoprotein Med (substrate-binding protein (PBP1-ABC) superfamily)